MRRLMLAALVLAACDSPTYPAGRLLPQTEWTVTYARFADGALESAMIAAPDSAGRATLVYRCMKRAAGPVHSLNVWDAAGAAGVATAVLEPDTAHRALAFTKNGTSSAERVGDDVKAFMASADDAWTLTLHHSDGSVHRWGTANLGDALRTAWAACGA